jgi:hypothetical protein
MPSFLSAAAAMNISRYPPRLGIVTIACADALAPQVVQHVGRISSRNNLAINTMSTWASWFETQDPLKLRKDHEELVGSSIWRATGDGS